MENVVDSAMNRIEEDKVKGIFFDGKKDKTTKILRFNEDTKHYHSEIVEEHYTVTWEPAGKYLFHYTPEPADADEKAAKKIANPIYDWLLVRNLLGDLVMIRGDSTSTITGAVGGAIQHIEKLLGRKCHWNVCMIHINELPLRHLVITIDGKYIPKQGWTGPIGKLLEKVNTLEINPEFTPFPELVDIISIPEDIAKKMSTDQKNRYLLLNAMKSGILSSELANIKCGPLNQSRWLVDR